MKPIIAGILALLLFASMGSHADTAEQESVRGVQGMLKECGFNPGPIDGLWGNRTAKAAKDYIRAHGGSPQSEKNLIVAQVDGYRAGDDGPCPNPAKAAQEDDSPLAIDEDALGFQLVPTTQGDQEGVGEDNLPGDVAFAQEKEQTSHDVLIAEISAELNGKHFEYFLGYDGEGGTFQGKIEVSGENITKYMRRYKKYEPSDAFGELTAVPPSEFIWTESVNISDIVSANSVPYPEGLKPGVYLKLSCSEDAENCVEFDVKGTYPDFHVVGFPVRSESENFMRPDITFDDFRGIDVNAIVASFDKLNAGGGTTVKPARCYEWADLGSITPGAWVNGDGRRTKAMRAGGDGKAYGDEKLREHYEKAHRECRVHAESALESAVRAMVIVGRYAVDVDNDKKAMRDYFQSRSSHCQAEFKSRYGKYANRFCE